ncbi:MAG: hypothetical protein ACLQMT_01375 [Candidatus Acidiferrales bacterium]
MKKVTLGLIILLIAGMAVLPAVASAQTVPGRPLKLVLARQSMVSPVDLMKDISEKCPNVTLTTNPARSDFMLYAGGWSGDYRFMVIAKGGDTIYATKTVMLSNAVKDVCRFLNTHS